MLNLSFFLFIFLAAFIATVVTNFIARDKGSRVIIGVWLAIFITLLFIFGLVINSTYL